MADKEKILFIGTGLMGAPMVRRLLGEGFPVTVWNRTASKAEALRRDGAKVADDLHEAAGVAEIVITMVENGPVVADLLFAKGLAQAMTAGTTFIDMSSIPPSMARKHAKALEAHDVIALDAPVSGGTEGAEQGTLAIMAGGDANRVVDLRSMFSAMGRVTHVGPPGAGQLSKLTNQAIVGITIGAVAEGLLLASAGGANPASVRNAIRGGFAESRILELHGARMIARDFLPGGMSRSQLKDLDTVIEEAEAIGLDLPLVKNVRDRYALLCQAGLSESDHSALLLELEQRNGDHRVGTGDNKLPE